MVSPLQEVARFSELAALLKIDEAALSRFSFPSAKPKYKSVAFKKRDGTWRDLAIPHSTLKMIQRRLLVELEKMYIPSTRAFAYIKGSARGIRANADAHLKGNIIFSVDLKDFFDQIHFGRVRGRLLAPPYGLSDSVATTIAHLTTFENKLPFGAPTSPIISNMICGGLDADLARFGRKNASFYTRYADDIVFSTSRTRVPVNLARILEEDGARQIMPGVELEKIINLHGFTINPTKTRLKTRQDSQIICGVLTNEKLNVRLKLRREIRGLLHAWRAHGHDNVQRLWVSKYGHSKDQDFESSLRGKIQFMGQIRGPDDLVVWKAVDLFNSLTEGKPIVYDLPLSLREGSPSYNWRPKVALSVCAITVQDNNLRLPNAISQEGSGFIFSNGLIMTNAHVVRNRAGRVGQNISVRFSDLNVVLDAEVIDLSAALDVAVLRTKDSAWMSMLARRALRFDFSGGYVTEASVYLAGYPNYNPGDTVHFAKGNVTGMSKINELTVFRISQNVVFGNSGGPVFNETGAVLGVAVCGSSTEESAFTIHNGAIPSDAIQSFVEPHLSATGLA